MEKYTWQAVRVYLFASRRILISKVCHTADPNALTTPVVRMLPRIQWMLQMITVPAIRAAISRNSKTIHLRLDTLLLKDQQLHLY